MLAGQAGSCLITQLPQRASRITVLIALTRVLHFVNCPILTRHNTRGVRRILYKGTDCGSAEVTICLNARPLDRIERGTVTRASHLKLLAPPFVILQDPSITRVRLTPAGKGKITYSVKLSMKTTTIKRRPSRQAFVLILTSVSRGHLL